MNELLLIASVVFIFGTVLLAFRLFGATGLYCVSVVVMVLANIEVLLLIVAFGVEQTLGNVLFASTFLITDILSECYGRRAANRAVSLGLLVSAFFLLLSQSWLLYTPSPNDTVAPAFAQIFSSTPRMMLASFAVYAVSQFFDVWLYHRWWDFTTRLCGDRDRFLWLRNNGSTLVSQIVNTALFTAVAFWGTYDFGTLVSIFASSYAIYIVTTLLDTPCIYLARRIYRRHLAVLGDGGGAAGAGAA